MIHRGFITALGGGLTSHSTGRAISAALIESLNGSEVECAPVNSGVMPLLSDMMITKEQVMPLFLEACPSFTEKLKEHRAFYEDEDLLYVELGEFAHHLVELHKANRTNEFPAVFEIIERLHLEGDAYVKEAATIGMLEGIQNVAGNSGVDPEEFLDT